MACFPGLPACLNWMAWFPQSSDKDYKSFEQRIASYTMQDPLVSQTVLAFVLTFNMAIGI
jgi:hypothetical protein